MLALLSREHPVSGSSHANANARLSRTHRANDFRSASFTECCPWGKAVSLHRQVFQTTSVTSFDSDHANPLLRLFLADHIPPVHDVTAPAHISAISAVTCSYLSCIALGFHASAESGFQLHLT